MDPKRRRFFGYGSATVFKPNAKELEDALGEPVRPEDASWMEGARSRLEGYLSDNEDISAGEFRDLLGITRKHAIPILEYFDTARITLRVGDKRVLRTRPEGG